jgi:anti-anti-sigma factor
MLYRKKDYDSFCEIFLEDRLLLLDREDFNEIVKNFISSPQQNLIINFENTQILDTSGLGYLLLALQRVEDAKKTMTLKNPCKTVKKILNMMNFGSIFNIEIDGTKK